MEKSWENFWTTGKVEDYLTYRNRVTDDINQNKKHENDGQQKTAARQSERDRSWKGSNYESMR